MERCFWGKTAVAPFSRHCCSIIGAIADLQNILQLCHRADQQHMLLQGKLWASYSLNSDVLGEGVICED